MVLYMFWDTTIPPERRAPLPQCGADRREFSPVSSDRLIEDFNTGKPAALARVVSIVENHRDGFEQILGSLHPRTGRARRAGLTSTPEAGKSTTTSLLVKNIRAHTPNGAGI